jgi:hypothetical protein
MSQRKQSPNATHTPRPQHEVLWALAHTYLQHAKQLLPMLAVGDHNIREEYRRDVAAAIGCLQAILQRGSIVQSTPVRTIKHHHNRLADTTKTVSVLATKIELKTRCMLARILFEYTDNYTDAEEHAKKAVRLDMDDLLRKHWINL